MELAEEREKGKFVNTSIWQSLLDGHWLHLIATI